MGIGRTANSANTLGGITLKELGADVSELFAAVEEEIVDDPTGALLRIFRDDPGGEWQDLIPESKRLEFGLALFRGANEGGLAMALDRRYTA